MKTLLSILSLCLVLGLNAQNPISRNINIPMSQNVAPSMNGDRNKMIFLSTATKSGDFGLYYAESNGGWQKGTLLDKKVANPYINYNFGYFLDFKGDRIYMSSRLGSGDYNIVYVEREGDGWSSNQKQLKGRVSTQANEASPSISADGRYMYFMRCTEVTDTEANGCELYVSEWGAEGWGEAEKLNIDLPSDRISTPRILPDNKKLIFSARGAGGKGGYEFFFTERIGDSWSKPELLEHINTPFDDIGGTFSVYGHRLYYGYRESDRGFFNIVSSDLGEKYKSDDIVVLKYTINRSYSPGRTTIKLIDTETGEVIRDYDNREVTGSLLLEENKKYLLIATPVKLSNQFVAQYISIEELDHPEIMEMEIDLTTLESSMIVEGFHYMEKEPYIADASGAIIPALSKFLRTNASSQLELELVMTNYQEDSIQSAELTEIRVDSVKVPIPMDSIDSESQPDSTSILSEAEVNNEENENLASEIDSLNTKVQEEPTFKWEYIYTYHNDRLAFEVLTLQSLLREALVDLSTIKITGVIEEPAEGKPDRFIRIKK